MLQLLDSAQMNGNLARADRPSGKIQVDRKRWEQLSEQQKAIIILHELGHLKGNDTEEGADRSALDAWTEAGGLPGEFLAQYAQILNKPYQVGRLLEVAERSGEIQRQRNDTTREKTPLITMADTQTPLVRPKKASPEPQQKQQFNLEGDPWYSAKFDILEWIYVTRVLGRPYIFTGGSQVQSANPLPLDHQLTALYQSAYTELTEKGILSNKTYLSFYTLNIPAPQSAAEAFQAYTALLQKINPATSTEFLSAPAPSQRSQSAQSAPAESPSSASVAPQAIKSAGAILLAGVLIYMLFANPKFSLER